MICFTTKISSLKPCLSLLVCEGCQLSVTYRLLFLLFITKADTTAQILGYFLCRLLICRSEKQREILKCTVLQKQICKAIQRKYKEINSCWLFNLRDGSNSYLRKKNSGLSHWAAIGNLKTIEIKDSRKAIISEETLLSAFSIQHPTRQWTQGPYANSRCKHMCCCLGW